jgi:hypothetical protein
MGIARASAIIYLHAEHGDGGRSRHPHRLLDGDVPVTTAHHFSTTSPGSPVRARTPWSRLDALGPERGGARPTHGVTKMLRSCSGLIWLPGTAESPTMPVTRFATAPLRMG